MIGTDGIVFGGDYNPEQWPEDVWVEDIQLMREAGVNLVNLGVFAWAHTEPRPGQFEFDWLDTVLSLLWEGGVRVGLATPTAAPPAWLFRADPSARPVTREGTWIGGGARQTFCPNSPSYAEAAARITRALGQRYGDHPALALWHIHNEYGAINSVCYCDTCAESFRRWLRARYGDLGSLNSAWGTTFWGQRYAEWEEIEPPRHVPVPVNPAQELDYLRCANHSHLTNYRRERDILREFSPDTPMTTNFMIANCKGMDYWQWAGEVDVVANNHYLQAERPDNQVELAMAADLTRAVAHGAPWLLTEHSTGAVNWQDRNIAKTGGQMARNSLAHLARGADGLMFFQWRASRFGGEKFHSAMVPQGGTNTRIWGEVRDLGRSLGALAELRGARVDAEVAVVWDWQSWWAMELPWHPTVDLDFRERVEAYYTALWNAGITVDFVHPEAELGRYRAVIVPSLYLTTPEAAKNLTDYVAAGGTMLVSYFSGIVDANDTIHPGAFPGALREVLGLEVEEFLPLRAAERIEVDGGLSAGMWAEHLRVDRAETLMRYVDGPAAGEPAVTRNAHGRGHAWYVSTRLGAAGVERVLGQVCAEVGVQPVAPAPIGVEVVRRRSAEATYTIVINHTPDEARLPVPGHELLTATPVPGDLVVPGGAVRVVRGS